jgi:hypothetical protein
VDPVTDPRCAAHACGAFFSANESEIVDMSDQRVVLVLGDGVVDLAVQVAYEGDPASFAWVYPLPAVPELTEGGASMFANLDEDTRPRFWIELDEDPGCQPPSGACQDYSAGGRGNEGGIGDDGVDVWDEGQVGIFDYATITAVTIDDMLSWLENNGFVAPQQADAVLQHYVDVGWYFVAMKINPEAAGTGAVTSTVRFSYASSSNRYPLYMSSISPASTTGILLYVFAEHRQLTTGAYATAEVDLAGVEAISELETNYTALFDAALAAQDGRAFVVEAVMSGMEGNLDGDLQQAAAGMLMTRLRTAIVPVDIVADVDFADAPTDDTFRIDLTVDWPPPEATTKAPVHARSGWALALVPLVWVLWTYRRSRRIA